MRSFARIFSALALCHFGASAFGKDVTNYEKLAQFSPDHKSIIVEAPGIDELAFGSAAMFQVDGTKHSLSSNTSQVLSSTEWTTVETPMGRAEATSATYGDTEFSYTLTLKILPEIHAIALEGVFHNKSDRDVNLRHIELLSTFAGGAFVLDSSKEWLVTPLMEDAPAEAFSAMQRTCREAAMVYNAKGTGFLIGPTGPPEAFTEIEFKDGGMIASAKMEGVLVKAGQSRRGEPMVVCFDSPDTATKIWTRWVAATHGARLHRERVYGWCSWYSRTTNIDEKHTRDVLGILADNPNVFGKSVLQLDDGYQIMDGDWRGNAKFPSGLAKLAKDIRAKGVHDKKWGY